MEMSCALSVVGLHKARAARKPRLRCGIAQAFGPAARVGTCMSPIILGNGKAMHLRMARASEREWDSMQQDDAAETKRHDESARTPVAAKKGVTAKKVLEHIDPERLSKAIRYLKEHPKFVR
jgi:hypothetical protein